MSEEVGEVSTGRQASQKELIQHYSRVPVGCTASQDSIWLTIDQEKLIPVEVMKQSGNQCKQFVLDD